MRLLHPFLLFFWIVLLAFFFANVEIQIEGSHGWAANLPTWRIEKHWLLDSLWSGRPLTGYHVWVFSFMAIVFHLPILMNWRFGLRLEARALSCLAFFWIFEDFFWFAFNPAFGLRKLTPEFAWWHKSWLLGVPSDYVIFFMVALFVYWYSFTKTARQAPKRETRAE